MKNPSFSQIVAALAAVLFSLQSSRAAVETWNAAGGGNWSVNGNWTPAAAPTQADDAVFGNTGTGNTSTMDATRTINSLLYNQNNGTMHTTTFSSGQTLTVNRLNTGDVLYIGAASAPIVVTVTINGAGGTLTLSGTGDFVVRQGNSATGAQMANLDLSGLDRLNATVGRLLVGQAIAAAAVNRPSGTLLLAKTNFITLSGAAPQVMIQDAGQNANGSVNSVLTFGQETHLYGDNMRLGGQKGNATINFNGSFSGPSLQLRNADGSSRVTTIVIADNSIVNSGNSTVVTMDLSPGVVDVLAGTVTIARGNPGTTSIGNCTGTLTIGAGTFDVNTLEIGFGTSAGASGTTTGTLNVNNNSLLSTGAVLVANTSLRLARTNGGTAAVTGTLNLNGGTVVASSIVAGGGNSVINVNSGGKLVVTGSAGSLAAPIRSLSMSDGSLRIPALNGGAVIAVSNLTVGGSANTINISSVPPIGSYPATFTLINYQGGYTAGTGPLSLGTLPPASPAYSGTLVDTGGGVIQLRLTAGPVAVLGMHWTGATDNNWDLTTYNWTFQGIATNYFDGSSPLFDDSTTQSNIFLATALSPGSITVSNNTLQYAFVGSGNIAGAGTLTKKGSGSLIVANQGVDNIGTVVISSGTLQIGTNDVNGEISAINITNNGALVVNRSGNLTLSSAIAGTGPLSKNGSGTLILSGANSYSGTTLLNQGTLQVDQSSSGSGALTTSAGTTLAGSGTVNGPVTVGGQLNPGPVNGPGVFKAHGGLVLSPGSTLTFDLSATDPFNPAANDAVEVFGNLTANNNSITVNFAGTPQSGVMYPLFTYSGALSGSFNPTIQGTHFTASVDTSTPGTVYLSVTGTAGADLKWNSLSDTAWDATATNWLNLNSSAPSVFFAGDTALLDDTSGVQTGITIASGVSVYPSVLTNSSTNNNFSISGAGHISGTGSIVKTGLSTLTLATANNFTGPADIQAGILQIGSDTALGTTASGTTVHDGATLDIAGHTLGGEVVTASGSGVSGQGAIINSGAAQAQAFRQVILAGDTTFGGSGLWAINNGGGAASLSTLGSPYSLTKVGGNQVNLAQLASVDAALADIDIQQGTIEFSGLTSSMGDSSRTNFVRSGATLSFANGTVAWNKQFNFTGNGATSTVNNGTGANTELAGPVELHGDCVFNVGGTLMTISSAISGDGGLIKNGGSPLILTNVNTYTGDTRINTAALRLNGDGSISNSLNVIIAAGATLTATGRVDATFTLASGQTLKGNGVINGALTAAANSTVAPGIDAIGALTVSNAVTLAGVTTMELDPSNGTNDFLRSNSSITYGGTLNLISLGGPLANGATFKLFNASSYLNSFGSITPATPGPGQTWDISALGTSGTIKVAAVPQPRFGNISIVGASLVMSGSNGVASGTYYVLASTNVMLPRGSWTRIATNSFDSNGNFSFTNIVTATPPQRFFLLQLP